MKRASRSSKLSRPEHVFPEIRRAVAPASRIGQVASAAVVTLVEGQEPGRTSGKPGGHYHRFGIDGEMHQRPLLERENRLVRIAVASVLVDGILDGLAGERVLQLDRGDRDAVEAQRDVERFLRRRGIAELAGDPDAVGRVGGLQLRVQPVRGLEERRPQRAAVALEAVAQGCERAVGVHPLAQIGQHLFAGLLSEERFQLRPFAGLRLADEVEHGLREDRALAVEARTGDRQIAVAQQVGFDDRLEGGFAGRLHGVHSGLEGAKTGRRIINFNRTTRNSRRSGFRTPEVPAPWVVTISG